MITNFQKKVYKILKRVPKGKVTTYKKIADKLKNSPRAVGNALNKNPYSYNVISSKAVGKLGLVIRGDSKKIGFKFCDFNQGAERSHRSIIRGDSKRTSGFFLVPCHRVIKTNGEIGGFSTGKRNKSKLLKKEGIQIFKDKIDLKKYGFGYD